mmetsp:Transcript_28826/g.87188  ORF Transcript_28826/g.87188 Transcript_28826/m.87188 type:complete len:183 (-) Transcript_28826:1744-2292(-)
MREATWSRNRSMIQQAIGDFERSEGENLKNQGTWVATGASHMYDVAKRCLDDLEQAQSRLEQAERGFLQRLEDLKSSTDVAALQSALGEADSRKVGGEMVALIRARHENLQRQHKYVEEIRTYVYSNQGSHNCVQDLLEELINEGLDDPERWILDGGPRRSKPSEPSCPTRTPRSDDNSGSW